MMLTFIPDFSTMKFEFFEIDNDLLDKITSNGTDLIIKPYQIEKQKTAALCSSDKTYRLKRSETSNTFLFGGLRTGNIYK
jgi:hypothetical protein